MKLNNKELEELLTINEQAKVLMRGLTYCEELGKEIFNCMKNTSELSRECSHIYENSLGKTRFVNEDIFNEVDTILSKYKSIIGGK